jgi:hypothetical protein
MFVVNNIRRSEAEKKTEGRKKKEERNIYICDFQLSPFYDSSHARFLFHSILCRLYQVKKSRMRCERIVKNKRNTGNIGKECSDKGDDDSDPPVSVCCLRHFVTYLNLCFAGLYCIQ